MPKAWVHDWNVILTFSVFFNIAGHINYYYFRDLRMREIIDNGGGICECSQLYIL